MTQPAASNYIDSYNAMVDRGREVAARYANRAVSSLADSADNLAETSTPLGNAQPFQYSNSAPSYEDIDVAGLGNRGNMYACDVISSECKGSVLREFPGQYLNSTLNDIQSDAQDGVKDARKALKLLNDGRFKK